jgi:hypothetical protein
MITRRNSRRCQASRISVTSESPRWVFHYAIRRTAKLQVPARGLARQRIIDTACSVDLRELPVETTIRGVGKYGIASGTFAGTIDD